MRLDRAACARDALRTQLAAFEDYYAMSTAELLAHCANDSLPARIPRSEAARWAELLATLERLAVQPALGISRS